jgi:hypothetical protein
LIFSAAFDGLQDQYWIRSGVLASDDFILVPVPEPGIGVLARGSMPALAYGWRRYHQSA